MRAKRNDNHRPHNRAGQAWRRQRPYTQASVGYVFTLLCPAFLDFKDGW